MPNLDKESVLSLKHLSFGYTKKRILDDFSLTVHRGEIVCVMGASGSGKSTLLHLIDGSLHPQEGELTKGKTASIFQDPYSSFHPHYPIIEQIRDIVPSEDLEPYITKVGLTMEHFLKLPHELSGGQLQRCSIVRALAMKPDLLLADEPTSALDNFVGLEVMKLLVSTLQDVGILLVTHDEGLATWCGDKMVRL